MKLIKEVDIINDKKAVVWLNVVAIFLVVLFWFLFKAAALLINPPAVHGTSGHGLAVSLIILFVLVIVHEGIHGLFFKVFNPKGTVSFGFKNGMAYATSPGSFYPKAKFAIIAGAPFIIISSGLLVVLAAGILSPPQFTAIAAVHASGCVGDFYWLFLISKSPKGALVEDTDKGINIYVSDAHSL